MLTSKIVQCEALALEDANLAAVQRIERWLETSLDAYQTIGVESVLSSGKYRRLVAHANKRGFDVRMIYVVLRSAELQIERVRIRVAHGGHDVPAAKIIDRRLRSFEQFAWFVNEIDNCYVYDNSTTEPELVAAKATRGPLWLLGQLPLDMMAALREAGTPIVLRER